MLPLPSTFQYSIFEEKNNVYKIRANMSENTDMNDWIKDFSALTTTNWIVKREVGKPQRCAFSKLWFCQHNKKGKQKASKRNTQCQARIKLLVKKVTKDTKKTDPYLRLSTPLRALIVINNNHNHALNDRTVLKQLRMDKRVKSKLITFFNSGLGPTETKKKLEEGILQGDDGTEKINNAQINPTYNMVYNLYQNWRDTNGIALIKPRKHKTVSPNGRTAAENRERSNRVVKFCKAKKNLLQGRGSVVVSGVVQTGGTAEKTWEINKTEIQLGKKILPENNEPTLNSSLAQQICIEHDYNFKMTGSNISEKNNDSSNCASAKRRFIEQIQRLDKILPDSNLKTDILDTISKGLSEFRDKNQVQNMLLNISSTIMNFYS